MIGSRANPAGSAEEKMLDWMPLVAVIGLGVAALTTFFWRSAVGRLERSRLENEAINEALAAAQANFDKEQKARRRQAEELAEFRKRSDKAKRRTGKTVAPPLGTASRIQDLEAKVEGIQQERDRIRFERDAVAEELAKLKARVEVETRAAAERAARAAAVEPAPDPRPGLEAALEQSRERIEKLESESKAAGQNAARLRKRIDTQEQLYASLRAELEVKKDRLRTQEEQLQRLQALKVAVLD